MKHRFYFLAGIASVSLTSLLYGEAAQAVPSFARQTGMACVACHTNGFSPNLTPFGRKFKLGGYTLGGSGEGPLVKGIPPISASILGSFTHTDQGQARQPVGGPSSPAFNSNDNFALDEATVFYAGRIYGPVGAFAAFAYDGVENKVEVDHIDIRDAGNAELWGHDIDYGVSLNNNPTVQDLWNTTPAWSFPFTSSPLAPRSDAGRLASDCQWLGPAGRGSDPVWHVRQIALSGGGGLWELVPRNSKKHGGLGA